MDTIDGNRRPVASVCSHSRHDVHRMRTISHSARVNLSFLCLLMAGLLASTMDMAQATTPDEVVRAYQTALVSRIAAPARSTYLQIEGDGRRLLAARSYLRAGDSLPARWGWSSEEIQTFNRSHQFRALTGEIDKVRMEFERQNPGYSLYANTQVRSVDLQLRRWNANPTVARVAEQLRREARQHLIDGRYPSNPDERALHRFGQFLTSWHSSLKAPLAAPGLSAHGRARAIDFQVQANNRIVAPTETAVVKRVWDGQGWSSRLQTAVRSASEKFRGPLLAPHEPWHYEYVP